jgi:hypothetical protein
MAVEKSLNEEMKLEIPHSDVSTKVTETFSRGSCFSRPRQKSERDTKDANSDGRKSISNM